LASASYLLASKVNEDDGIYTIKELSTVSLCSVEDIHETALQIFRIVPDIVEIFAKIPLWGLDTYQYHVAVMLLVYSDFFHTWTIDELHSHIAETISNIRTNTDNGFDFSHTKGYCLPGSNVPQDIILYLRHITMERLGSSMT
jgi:hypothetical protein